MLEYLRSIWRKILLLLRLSPLSLAEKCRLAFGAAVVMVLAIALLIPYAWMSRLTQQVCLNSSRAKSETLFRRHFQPKDYTDKTLAPLKNSGAVMDVNDPEIQWIRFTPDYTDKLDSLNQESREVILRLKADPERNDEIWLEKKGRHVQSTYVRLFRASDNCISCHNPQGSAVAFAHNEPVGAAVIKRSAGEVGRTVLMNRIWILVAGLIGGAGAIIAFYWITQRVILSPIRQLRAMANNVAEGNLNIRSAIRTGDEFEQLANAFNHMLDGLQDTQEKLRQMNKQLDDKIIELSDRNIELFKANKIKSEFLANISHEFRTPLNAIMGFAEIMRDKADLAREKRQKYAENIITSGKTLLTMINDLLDLAKTQAGKMKLHIEQAAVSTICREAAATFSLPRKKKRIKVKLLIDENIPPLVTDAGKVQQILCNFLSNAVKFTPEEGRIEIRAVMLDEKIIRIAVADNGPGIAEADKEKIFEKFRQADGSLTRATSGTGLGLAISQELSLMLAGSIGLDSEIGKGATFWLDIPVTLAREMAES